MFSSTVLKHFRELRRYVLNYQYEAGEGVIYFPKAKALMSGVYTHNVNGEDERSDHNIIPDEGLIYMLGVTMKGSPSNAGTAWYCALHAGTSPPDADVDADNYASLYSEITSATEGWVGNRILWVGDAVDGLNTEVVNEASPAAFTIVTATSLNVNGAGLLSVSGRGSQAGTMISAGKFSATRTLANTDTFNLKYKVDLDAV